MRIFLWSFYRKNERQLDGKHQERNNLQLFLFLLRLLRGYRRHHSPRHDWYSYNDSHVQGPQDGVWLPKLNCVWPRCDCRPLPLPRLPAGSSWWTGC